MKVAYLLPSLAKEAPIMVAVSIANRIVSEENQVVIYYFSGSIDVNVDSRISIRKIGFFDSVSFDDFDIVHSHLFRPDVFVFIKSFFSSPKVKFVSTLHNYFYAELKNYYNSVISKVFGLVWNVAWTRFNYLVVLTDDAKKYYKKFSFNKEIKRIYNGRDIAHCMPCDISSIELKAELSRDGKIVIGAYCNLIKRKNISLLIDYVSSKERYALIIYGKGPELLNLKAQVDKLGANSKVFFMGYQPHAYIYNEIFDIFAMPSVDEGFGLSIIEAALFKKRIVCSDIPVFRELFDEDSVSYFSPFSLESLDNAIENVLSKDSCGICAYNHAIKYFTEDRMANEYLALYRELIRGGHE